MTRRYDMRQRALDAERTGRAIVDAAHALLDAEKASGLTLDEVARKAGVSRATVYNRFGSRPELLAAVFEDQGRRIGYDRVQKAQAHPDARQALAGMLRELARAWAVNPRALRRVQALAVIDPEIGAVVERYEGYRRAEMAAFARRLDQAGLLGAGVTAAEAAAYLALVTGPQAFHQLLAGGSQRTAARRLTALAFAALGISPEPESDRVNSKRGGT
jgi:TetR/AcrR family transcriptional repressor of mexJK operon